MNNEKDIVVGLDIGTTKIACFIGQRGENGKVKILGFGKTPSKGVERGVVKSITSTADSITKAVTDASEQAGIDVKEVYVGIAGQHIKSFSQLGYIMIPSDHELIRQEDIDALIEQQRNIMLEPGEEIIHVFPQNYIIDGEELSSDIEPVGVRCKQLKSNFHIVTGNTVNLMNIHDSVELAGLKIKGVVLEPVASSLAVLDDTDMSSGVALVDIGGGTTDIAIFHDGLIRHTSVLPLAGNAITTDIKEGCHILKNQAESLKTRFGSCLPQNVNENDIISIPGIKNQPAREISMRTLASIIKARTETILEQVEFEISKSQYKKDLLAGIVLTGGGAQLRHIKEFTEYQTGIDTRIGLPNEHLETDTDREIINTMYSTGIGLVLYGLARIDAQRSANNKEEEPEPDEQPTTNSSPFDNMPPMPENIAFGDAPYEAPKVEKPIYNTPEDKNDKKKKNRIPGLISYVEKYFGRVFGDETIRNEGDDEEEELV